MRVPLPTTKKAKPKHAKRLRGGGGCTWKNISVREANTPWSSRVWRCLSNTSVGYVIGPEIAKKIRDKRNGRRAGVSVSASNEIRGL